MSIEVISSCIFRNQRIGDLLVASLEGLFGGSIWAGCRRVMVVLACLFYKIKVRSILDLLNSK